MSPHHGPFIRPVPSLVISTERDELRVQLWQSLLNSDRAPPPPPLRILMKIHSFLLSPSTRLTIQQWPFSLCLSNLSSSPLFLSPPPALVFPANVPVGHRCRHHLLRCHQLLSTSPHPLDRRAASSLLHTLHFQTVRTNILAPSFRVSQTTELIPAGYPPSCPRSEPYLSHPGTTNSSGVGGGVHCSLSISVVFLAFTSGCKPPIDTAWICLIGHFDTLARTFPSTPKSKNISSPPAVTALLLVCCESPPSKWTVSRFSSSHYGVLQYC